MNPRANPRWVAARNMTENGGSGSAAPDHPPVLIVDDDDKLRAAIAELLKRGGYRTREAATGRAALAAASEERPSVVLLDVHLPGMSGYEVCHALRGQFGDDLPVLFLSGERTEPFDRVAGLRLGGDDYLVKPFDPDELLARVARFVERMSANRAREPATFHRLTRRELEVLELLADGRAAKEIARDLYVSPKTIATHIQNILVKLDVHSQAQAVGMAFRSGLIKIDSSAAAASS